MRSGLKPAAPTNWLFADRYVATVVIVLATLVALTYWGRLQPGITSKALVLFIFVLLLVVLQHRHPIHLQSDGALVPYACHQDQQQQNKAATALNVSTPSHSHLHGADPESTPTPTRGHTSERAPPPNFEPHFLRPSGGLIQRVTAWWQDNTATHSA